MRILKPLAALLIALCGIPLWAQQPGSVEIAGGYVYTRSNAPPGQCGCFSMNGGMAEVSTLVKRNFAVVANFAAATNGSINGTGISLTEITYLFGPRLRWQNRSRLVPFAEVLLGGAHASGSNRANGSALGFAAGGGIDVRARQRLAIRPFDFDYVFTRFANGVNSQENHLRLSVGIVVSLRRPGGNK
ncbi:MAG: hypothetical protein JO041_14195 [Acidobacteria bacterium]|nr:hypothetical protein [Acidobacteriota bacterium]